MSDTSASGPGTVEIRHRPAERRWEALVQGAVVGHLSYVEDGAVSRFEHTVVRPEFGGRGIAARMTAAALADLRARGIAVVAVCSYTGDYLARHPEEADLRA